MDFIVRAYNYMFYERADPRVNHLPMMGSPKPIAAIVLVYLLMIKVVLPAYMKNRQAYELKTVIKWYNVLQIVLNSIATWGIATSGWTTTYYENNFWCPLPDYSMDPQALRMINFFYMTYLLKILELVETSFFVLRKRDHQASFLHIYHHVTTMIILWSGTKYVAGGVTSFCPLINNPVHVVMYSYYLGMSDGGPRLRKVLNKYKKWITVMQMVQFTFMLIYCSQVFHPNCVAPMGITWFFFPNVVFVFYLFYRFYQQSYIRRANKSKSSLNGTSKEN